MDNHSSMMDAALRYAARGWAVFPVWPPTPEGGCTCGRANCDSPGKHPLGSLVPRGLLDATTDRETLTRWWTAQPGANIGVAAGASGLCILDIDTHDADGFTTWAELTERHGIAGDTLTAITGGGGRHLFYAAPPDLHPPAKLGPGVDVKANGGYVVLPPSRHASGNSYAFDADRDPARTQPAPLPPALRALLERSSPTSKTPSSGQTSGTVIKQTSTSYLLDLQKAEAALGCLAQWRCDDYGEAGGWLQVGMALRELEDRGLALWETWSRGSPKFREGVCAEKWETFTPGGNGKGRGLGSLYEWAYQDNPTQWGQFLETLPRTTSPSVATTSSTSTSGAQPAVNAKPVKVKTPTDDELAARWLREQPLTAWGLGEFRRYEVGIWSVLSLDTVRREVVAFLEAAKAEGIRPTSRLLSSVIELGRVEIAKRDDAWDADPDILVCGNGALHIPTRTLQAHNPEHLATSRLSYDYDPEAKAPTWQRVLQRCVPEARNFLQEFAGYALTTDTRFELAVWLAGQPGGGKSTLLAGLEAMLGPRVLPSLGLGDIEKSRFALTNLPGRTLVISTEQPGGYLAASAILNAIISGEPITVDRKFRDPVTIVPRAKLMWALNELPRVGPDGAGLFRRVKVVRLPPIPEDERDPAVKEQVKLEGAGILVWALDGLARLRSRGRFEIPAGVADATNHFRETNDIPAVFVAECCLAGVNKATGYPYKTQSSILYGAYSQWCKDNGHKAQSSTSIAEDWLRLGFEKYPANGRIWWRGVGVAVEAPRATNTDPLPPEGAN
jgi:P4 family phage/plasmid primase-like protien